MYLNVLGFHNHQKLMQYSWNYMNDSLRTDVFVRYQPETVACACIYLTARKLKLPLPKHPSWFSIFGANEEEIRDISMRILKLYTRPKVNVLFFCLQQFGYNVYRFIVFFSQNFYEGSRFKQGMKNKLRSFLRSNVFIPLQ